MATGERSGRKQLWTGGASVDTDAAPAAMRRQSRRRNAGKQMCVARGWAKQRLHLPGDDGSTHSGHNVCCEANGLAAEGGPFTASDDTM
jgi:hypothetical protein